MKEILFNQTVWQVELGLIFAAYFCVRGICHFRWAFPLLTFVIIHTLMQILYHPWFMNPAFYWLHGKLQYNALYVLICIAGFIRLYIWLTREKSKKLLNILSAFFVLDAIKILAVGDGFFPGNTFDLGVMAIMLPYIISRWNFPTGLIGFFLILAAMFKGHGATAFLVLTTMILAGVAGRFARGTWRTLKPGNWVATVGILLLCVLPVMRGVEKLKGHHRIPMWTAYYEFVTKEANQWIGTGLGSFYEWAPFLYKDKLSATQEVVYTFAHNDYLQILFELGWIGLGLVLVTQALALYKLRHAPLYFNMLVGFFTCMIFYSPLQFLLSGLLLVAILKRGSFEAGRMDAHAFTERDYGNVLRSEDVAR